MRPTSAETSDGGRIMGRGRELRRLRSLLRSARLLTLIGPPGVGKSRLAKELFTHDGEHVVRSVEIFDSFTSGSLRSAVAFQFGVSAGRLLDAIGDTRVTIVLDGCEHAIEPCATLVAELLCHCSGLRFVATSQEPMRVPGEITFRVGPLAVPEPGTDNSHVLRTDAVRLFLGHAQRIAPGFAARADDIGVIADICRACDGLPSAIARAAGQVRNRALRTIRTDSADHDGTAPIAAPIADAYRRLAPAERTALRQLSILPGGFDLDTARAICAVPGAKDGVVPLVCELEGKSMINTVRCADGTARFRMLESVRVHVRALANEREVAATEERIVTWLSHCAESLTETLFVADAGPPTLAPQRENLVAALRFPAAREHQRHILLALSLARVLWHGQQAIEARRILADIRECSSRSRWHSDVLALSALAASSQASHADALDFAEQAVRVADRPLSAARAWEALGFARECRGECTAAVAAYLACLDIVRAYGKPLTRAECQHCLARTLLLAGRTLAAKQFLGEAMPVITRHGPRRSRIAASNTVGALHLAMGDDDAARKAFATVLRSARPGDHVTSYALDGLAILAARHDDARRVLVLSVAASQIRARCGVEVSRAWQHSVDEVVTAATGVLGPERTQDATTAGRRLRGEQLLAYALRDADKIDSPDGRPDVGVLTRRERQIAGFVAEGLTDREIGEALGLAQRTIRAHLTSIHQKLDLRSRIQVAVWTTRRTGPAVDE